MQHRIQYREIPNTQNCLAMVNFKILQCYIKCYPHSYYIQQPSCFQMPDFAGRTWRCYLNSDSLNIWKNFEKQIESIADGKIPVSDTMNPGSMCRGISTAQWQGWSFRTDWCHRIKNIHSSIYIWDLCITRFCSRPHSIM